MRRTRLFAPIAVLIAGLSACNAGGRSAATPALPGVSNATVPMPAGIPDSSAREKIYIANSTANDIVTYTANGKATKPTIAKGVNDPGIIAIDSKGEIFVPNYYNNTVATYKSNGKPAKPTISVGLNEPTGVAVDAKGKTYVTNAFTSNVTTYKPNGQQTTPTISNIDGLAALPSMQRVKSMWRIFSIASKTGKAPEVSSPWMARSTAGHQQAAIWRRAVKIPATGAGRSSRRALSVCVCRHQPTKRNPIR